MVWVGGLSAIYPGVRTFHPWTFPSRAFPPRTFPPRTSPQSSPEAFYINSLLNLSRVCGDSLLDGEFLCIFLHVFFVLSLLYSVCHSHKRLLYRIILSRRHNQKSNSSLRVHSSVHLTPPYTSHQYGLIYNHNHEIYK